MQKSLFVFCLLIWAGNAYSQATNAPLNEDYYHLLDRYEIKTGRIAPELFTTLKPYKRNQIAAYVDSLGARGAFQVPVGGDVFMPSDTYNHEYFRNDNWEWSRAATAESKKPIWNTFYRKKSDFYSVDIPDFDLHINPVLNVGFGKDNDAAQTLFVNTRGVELRTMIDRKIGLYLYFTDNQAILPNYVDPNNAIHPVIPHEGFWKRFKANGVDYFQARGYLDVNISKHVYVQLGHDRMFVGNGVRSLIWSDYAPPQLYLRANVKVWKMNYMFQLNRMTADVIGNTTGLSNGKYPEKYVAFHHASVNIGKKLNIGFFESIIFSPQDSVNGDKASFEWNYVNPIIFYRAIEQQNGSNDNAILGMDLKWNVAKGISLYGQLVLDEFLLSHIKARDGWWANKFAVQAGLKYIDAFFVPNLDLQLETNIVRPYTYSHSTKYANYMNYMQPIAHPLGANFNEFIGVLRYQPIGRLNLTGKLIYVKGGLDAPGMNYGSDPMLTYSTRVQEFGNKIGQGIPMKRTFISFTASYMVKHNLFVDLQGISRSNQLNNDGTTTSIIAQMAVRWNIAPRNFDF